MKLKFTKMHGCGNDYIYFNCFEQQVADPEALSIRLSDRHFGIGGDGIVLICPSDVADAKMRMFNADGSEGKMCGNATRCIGKYMYEHGLISKPEMTLETLSGIKILKMTEQDGKIASVRVDMGKAILKPSEIPTRYEGDTAVSVPLTVDGTEYAVTCVSMGNPHCIVFVDQDVSTLDLPKIGPSFENHDMFPERINTEFIRVMDDHTLQMRVWERGSGETLACGTGSTAALAVTARLGKCGDEADVILRGGTLHIAWDRAQDLLYMTGPAAFVFDGTVTL